MRFLQSPTHVLWLKESRAVLHLSVPLALTQIAHMAISTTDVVMMGWIGADALAAGTLTSHFYWFFVAFAMGMLTGATPVMAQHLGARRFRRIRPAFRNAAWLALMLAVPVAMAAWFSGTLLGWLDQDPEIASAGQSYLRHMVFGLIPGLWLVVVTELLVVHGRPRAVLVVTLGGIGLNAVLDYMLMFGNWGAPELGLDGAGIASAGVNFCMFVALAAYALSLRQLKRYRLLGRFWRIERPVFFEIMRVGTPIAVTEVAEMGLFIATSLLMGLLGTEVLAAHGVTAQCYAIFFMIPVGLAQAGAVRVGLAAGAVSRDDVARAGWTASAMAGIAATVLVSFFCLAGSDITGLILDPEIPENASAAALAVTLLRVASFFMIFDAVQIASRGALQGLKDTKVPMFIALGTSWGVGLPSAPALGFWADLGGLGIWLGMATAMLVASALLVSRLKRQVDRFGMPETVSP